MKYKPAFALVLVALLARDRVVVSAQQRGPDSLPSLMTQMPPAQSFEDLRTRIKPGANIIVRDAKGRATRGRLTAFSGDQIEVESWRWLRLRHRMFIETDVRRVEIRDSTWNGTLIGLGLGGAVAGLGCMADHGGYGCEYLLLLAPILGGGIGSGVDALINRPVFQATGGSTITLSPVVAAGRIGIAARVHFQ